MSKNLLKENLRWYYKNLGETQESFAIARGVTRAQFESYLRGIAEPNLDFVNKICEELHITLNELLFTDLSKKLSKHSQEETATGEEANSYAGQKISLAYYERGLAVQEVLLEFLASIRGTTVEEVHAIVNKKVLELRMAGEGKGNA